MLARQLDAFGMGLLGGGLADQPMGYLCDVQEARAYERAKELYDAETAALGSEHPKPAPEWAKRLVDPVVEWILTEAEDE